MKFKKPVVDYRQFRLSKLKDPQFSHLLLLLGWIGYFILYFLTENLIPRENCVVMHCFIDDLIPFCEWFVIPYTFWYLLIVFSLLYFALYNIDNFKNLMKYIIVTQIVAMAVYIILPNCQNLRPAEFENDNILTMVVGLLYKFDTSTNVCPSLHVAYSLGIVSTWFREKSAGVFWKIFVLIAVILICLSTMFIKQHSAVDVIAALPLGVLAEFITFYFPKFWLKIKVK